MVSELEKVFSAVQELAAGIADRGAEIEQAGRLPADIVAGLHEAGVFRLWMPVELGGFEANPADVVALLRTLSEADGSTGWCSATGVASNIAGALLSEQTARQMYATGSELCGGVLMPSGQARPQPDGGYLVDGRWSFGSGTQHCDWVVGAAFVVSDGPPSVRAVLMPVAEVEFLDTWQVVGLSGTASVDYQVSELYVPASRVLDLVNLVPWPTGSMWRIPLRSLLYPVLAAVPLGIASRAATELSALADRVRYGSQTRLADRSVVQAAVARARALIDSGTVYLSAKLQALRDAADSGRVPTATERAEARLAAVFATEQSERAVSLCYQSAGTAAIYRGSPLQRALRDVNTTTQHYALSGQGYELTGRVLLGFEPDPML